MSNFLKKSVETFRTAPIGVARLSLSTGGLAANTEVLAHAPEMYQTAPLPLIAASIALAGLKIARQRRQRAQLENSLDREGFNDRIFAATTAAWCLRQTARIACKEKGYLAEYEALCESEGDERVKWLPHIP